MPKSKRQQIIEKRNDQAMMEHPDQWPCWPWLPIKRRKPHGPPDCAVLYAGSSDPEKVVFAQVGMYNMPEGKPITEWPGFRVVTPADLLAEGWVVD